MKQALRSMREAWEYRAALRRRVVRRDRKSPSETLWLMTPDQAIPMLSDLLPAAVSAEALRVAPVATPLVPVPVELGYAAPPSTVAAELVRSAALACVQRLTGREAHSLVA